METRTSTTRSEVSFRGDRFFNVLFLNPGHPGHFLYLNLVGVESNRSGVGARIRVAVETPSGAREIHRCAGCVSSFGGSPVLRQEIGLGDASRVRELEVWWPRSGIRQTFRRVPMDALIEVREGSSEIRTLPLVRLAFPLPPRRFSEARWAEPSSGGTIPSSI